MRELYRVPDNYKVLFLQGGASAQFSAIPLNFMNGSGKADYIITGQWAKKAYQEAQKYGDVQAVASSADKTFSYIPKTAATDFRDDADYVYICMNNTIYGTVYKELPPVGDKVLIADVSSCALSQPLDISKFGMVYFGAQKNVAPAGLVVAIIREDLQRTPHHPGDDELSGTGKRGLPLQHAPLLVHLYLQTGTGVDQSAGRPGSDGKAQPGKGKAAV